MRKLLIPILLLIVTAVLLNLTTAIDNKQSETKEREAQEQYINESDKGK